jgi:hypothetical protein
MRLKIDVIEREGTNLEFGREVNTPLVAKKFCKNFQILRHIKSLDTCMKH